MSDTNDFASRVHEQQREREQARIDAMRKQETKLSDEARKVLSIERIQKPEPIA
jgi:uncharacterized protein YdcH (DUF465 family)